MNSCFNCKWCVDEIIAGYQYLKCRRNPPIVDLAVPHYKLALFPTVNKDYWCGEYMPKSVVLEVKEPLETDENSTEIVGIGTENHLKKARGRPKKTS